MNCKLLLVILAFCSVSSFAEPIELKVKSEVMKKAVMSAGTMTFTLPEFEVFNSNGIGIYHQVSLPPNFKSALKSAIKSPVQNSSLLKDTLSVISTLNNQDYNYSESSKFDFVFVEYWAEWCESCGVQMKQVKEFLSENPKIKVLWLKIERDPAKIEGMTADLKKT